MTRRIRYCVVRYYLGYVGGTKEVVARDLTMTQAKRQMDALKLSDPTRHEGTCFYRIDREVQP